MEEALVPAWLGVALGLGLGLGVGVGVGVGLGVEQWLALPNPNLGLIPVAVIVWLKPPSVPSMYRFLAVMPASFLQRPSPAPLISIMFCVIITCVRVRVRVKG